MLEKNRIENELERLGITPPEIVFYEQTDSTNTRAKEYAKGKCGCTNPVIFIANEQTAGRGRLGRSFVSEKGAGIYISILSFPEKSAVDATAVTARAAVLLARAIESMCDCEIKIKWVNDLYLGGKKIAGILTEGEVDSDGKITYQVVGMGINVYKNAISDEISDIATSIEDETSIGIDRSKLAATIIKYHLNYKGDFYHEYKSRSFIIGRRVTVMKLSESYEAKVLDINPDFSLKLKTPNGIENLFTGEVSLKI